MFELFQNPTNACDRNWSIYHGAFTPQIYAPQAFVILSSDQWQQAIIPNTWHQIRVTVGPIVSGQNQTIVYLDGLARTTNYPPAPNNNSTENWILHIGDFDGDIDEVRISNTVR